MGGGIVGGDNDPGDNYACFVDASGPAAVTILDTNKLSVGCKVTLTRGNKSVQEFSGRDQRRVTAAIGGEQLTSSPPFFHFETT